MRKNLAEELKKLDIAIGRKMFEINKKSNMKAPPSPLQARILDYLIIHQDKCINQKELEEELDVGKTTISNALLSMEKNEMIERTQSDLDARYKEIKSTKKSLNTFNDMSQMFEILDKEMLKGFSKEELNILYDFIKRIESNVRRKE